MLCAPQVVHALHRRRNPRLLVLGGYSRPAVGCRQPPPPPLNPHPHPPTPRCRHAPACGWGPGCHSRAASAPPTQTHNGRLPTCVAHTPAHNFTLGRKMADSNSTQLAFRGALLDKWVELRQQTVPAAVMAAGRWVLGHLPPACRTTTRAARATGQTWLL